MSDAWPSLHFSLSNPRDDGPTDLPRLLRRLADEMESRSIHPEDVITLTIHSEVTEDGPWWSATLVWSPD
jgi:hypothetical protein